MKLGPCVDGLEIWEAWKESEMPLNSDASFELRVWYEERKVEARGAWIEHRKQCISCCNKINGEYLIDGNVLNAFIGYLARRNSLRNLGTGL
jgi:hypothetical protein